MPDKKTHYQISAAAGAASAYLYACTQGQDLFKAIITAVGGYIGGASVASLADRIDMPNSPHHRAIAHGAVPVALVLSQTWRPLLHLYNDLNKLADTFDKKDSLADTIMAMVCRITSGFSLGVLVGYPAHLVADAFTAEGLPLIC